MARKKNKKDSKKAVLELNLGEHTQRLRAIPGTAGDLLKAILVWLAAGILLFALIWLTLGR
jgi:hypothetical protein